MFKGIDRRGKNTIIWKGYIIYKYKDFIAGGDARVWGLYIPAKTLHRLNLSWSGDIDCQCGSINAEFQK
jgi:hypothetical protein